MTTKEAANSDVQNQQNLFFQKKNMTLVHRKLSLLHGKPKLIKGPGLNPIKQVDFFTKWRAEICPERSDEIKDQARKARGRGRQRNNYIGDTENATSPQQSNRRGRPRKGNAKTGMQQR